MKKLILLFTILYCANILNAQTFSHHDYQYSDSVFNNPERGFYKYTERNDASTSLDVGTLNSYREAGYTLIYRIFYMKDFVNASISQAYLDKIKEDFSRMREAGIKGVIRFAYTSSMNAPYGDASPSQVNKHISQLKPILTDNSDVIAVMQAGFIGAWGEWYYSDYFATGSPSNVTAADMQERKVLIDTLLDALPKDRMIQVRYLGYKISFFDSIPVTLEEAYSGTPKSRISHHNDCFVSSDNDVGTYRYIVREKKYLEQDTKFTSIGGETCDWFPPRSNCDTSTREMQRFHWSFINQDYFGLTINEWKQSGCYSDMQKKLGYRYSLVNAEIQDSSKQNGSFSISFKLKNNGYSNPINPRDVEIVLKNKATGDMYFSRINTEIRKQELNTDNEYSTLVGIPSYIPNGDYEVYLNLPDPKPTIHNNPNYSIRLANPYSWDKALGMNSLKHTLHISNKAVSPSYNGDNYFLGKNNYQSANIKVDGSIADWNFFPAADSSSANEILEKVKIYNANDSLYFLLQGTGLHENCQIFIDSDFDNHTGMDYWTWADDGGVDYLIQNNELFKYNGTNGSGDWNWSKVSDKVLLAKNSDAMELAVPLSLFNAASLKNKIRFGARNLTADWSTGESLPKQADNLLIYQVIPFLNPPRLYVTSYCQNAIVSFAPEQQDTSSIFVIERKTANSGNYSTVSTISGLSGTTSFKDNDLFKNTSYSYQAYRLNNNIRSPYSEAKQMTSGDCRYKYPVITADASENDWNAIVPVNAVSESKKDYFLKTYSSTGFLNMLLTGDSIVSYAVFIDTDNNALTGEHKAEWKTSGFEFAFTKDSVFKYGESKAIAKIDSISKNERGIEFKVPLELLGIGNTEKILNLAAIVQLKSKELNIPYKNRETALYERILPPSKPQNFEVRNSATNPSTKLIATWNKCIDCDGYVLTRTDQTNSQSTVFELLSSNNQQIDSPLKENNPYQYKLFNYNFSGKSPEAGPVDQSTTLTGADNISEEHDKDEIIIWPNPAKEEVNIQILFKSNSPVSIKIYTGDGKQVYSKELKVVSSKNGSQQIRVSTASFTKGIYLAYISDGNKQIVKKFIRN